MSRRRTCACTVGPLGSAACCGARRCCGGASGSGRRVCSRCAGPLRPGPATPGMGPAAAVAGGCAPAATAPAAAPGASASAGAGAPGSTTATTGLTCAASALEMDALQAAAGLSRMLRNSARLGRHRPP